MAKRSLFKNPTVSQRKPLDTSRVEDRRGAGDAVGGKIPYDSKRGTFGQRPRQPKYVIPERAEFQTSHDVGRAVEHAASGAQKMTRMGSKDRKLPWGWTPPGAAPNGKYPKNPPRMGK